MHFVTSLHEKYPKRRQHYKHSQNAYISDLVNRGDAKHAATEYSSLCWHSCATQKGHHTLNNV